MAPVAQEANYSLFSIPAYFFISMVPHIYSSVLLTPTKPSKGNPKPPSSKGNLYNMANPRSSRNASTYSANISPEAFATFERCRAAHSNMLENSAFFVSAILAGVLTRCEAGYMNRMSAAYLATRVLYTISYVGVSRGPLATLRTLWFLAGYAVLFNLWWRAGWKIVNGEY